MAQTKAQWLDKIIKFVPSWWFEKKIVSRAVFEGAAAIFAQIDQDSEDAQKSTFILEAPSPILEILGDERSVTKLPGETNPIFAPRVQTMFNQCNPVSLAKLLNEVLIKGKVTFRQHHQGDRLFVGQSYISRKEVLTYISFNTFTVVVDKQTPIPNSFLSRAQFLNQGNFIGTAGSSQVVLALVNLILNENAAAGVLYRFFERSS